jgi:hypothetical protein
VREKRCTVEERGAITRAMMRVDDSTPRNETQGQCIIFVHIEARDWIDYRIQCTYEDIISDKYRKTLRRRSVSFRCMSGRSVVLGEPSHNRINKHECTLIHIRVRRFCVTDQRVRLY